MLAAIQYIRNLLVSTPESLFVRYGFAAVAVTFATLLRLALNPFLLDTVPYITYFLAITVTGWIGGGRAAVFAVILSATAAKLLFLAPLYSLSISGIADVVAFAVFIAMGGMIAATCEAMKQALRRAETQAGLLKEHGQALQQQMHAVEQHKEALRENEERLRLAVQSGDLMVWDCDLVTRQVIYSPSAKEILGTERGTVSDFLASVYPDDRPLFEASQEAAAAGKIISVVEYRVIDPEGRIRWLQSRGNVRFDNNGRPVRFLGVSVDVTQRRSMEQKLRASEERFSSFMQYLSGAAWVKDCGGHYMYANPMTHSIFKTTEQQLYGKTDHDLFPAETARQFQDNDQIVITRQKALQTIEVFNREDGAHYSMVSKFPIFDHQGRLAFVGGIAFDITEWKQVEREREKLLVELQEERQRLQASQDQLKQKIEELESFHDIVVGRELKMIQMEKDIVKLRTEVSNFKTHKSSP
jgi:PAS domain S-box-containing protein